MSAEQRLQILRTAKPNSWIAVAEDAGVVVGKGDTFRAASEEASRQGCKDPLMIRIPRSWGPAVTCAWITESTR